MSAIFSFPLDSAEEIDTVAKIFVFLCSSYHFVLSHLFFNLLSFAYGLPMTKASARFLFTQTTRPTVRACITVFQDHGFGFLVSGIQQQHVLADQHIIQMS